MVSLEDNLDNKNKADYTFFTKDSSETDAKSISPEPEIGAQTPSDEGNAIKRDKRRPPVIRDYVNGAEQSNEPIDVDCQRLRSDTHYIFTFGEFGCGKTTVNGMVAMLLQKFYPFLSDPVGNGDGIALMNRIQNALMKGDFPDASMTKKSFEYDSSIIVKNKSVNLTFVEMSGEDLEKLETELEFARFINAYFLCPRTSMTYMLVADYSRVMGSDHPYNTNIGSPDMLFHTFLSYLYRLRDKEGRRVNMSKVMLVITKFDLAPSGTSIETLVRTKLPRTFHLLSNLPEIKSRKIFPFHIGEVGYDKNGKQYIEVLDLTGGAKAIAEYLMSALLPPTPPPPMYKQWFDKIKQFIDNK